MLNIQTILPANKMWTWRYDEKHTCLTRELLILRGEKNNLEHQKRLWGKWVGINVKKTSGFLVILREEILWKFIFSLKSKLLCYILLSAVHFTIQGSTRIDCDLFFYFWIVQHEIKYQWDNLLSHPSNGEACLMISQNLFKCLLPRMAIAITI